MGKFFLFLLLMLGLVLFVRGLPRRDRPRHEIDPPPEGRMVRCARCGVFHPEADSVSVNGRNFCSVEHSRETQ